MEILEQLDQITLIAQSGSAITHALGIEDQFTNLTETDMAAILYDLQSKFERINQLATSPTTDTKMTAA